MSEGRKSCSHPARNRARAASCVAIDDVQGRRIGAALGLTIVGSLGLVARAKALGIIQAISPLVEKAMHEGVHYHPDLVSRVLTAAGE